MKNKGVCDGCAYYKERCELPDLVGTCNFADMTGKCRIVIEMENGGIKHDSCICYEPKTSKKRVGWKWRKF